MGCNTIFVLAQEDKEIQGIKRLIENHLMGFNKRDLDSMMSDVSTRYSDMSADGNAIDYAKFKSMAKNLIENVFKKYVDYSISDLAFLKVDIKENKAIIKFEYKWKGFNLDTLKEDSGIHRRIASLEKENGTWKITQWKWLKP